MHGESEQLPRRGALAGRMASVGGLTFVSRVAGFARDVMLADVMGAGPVADAFFVALRLPNHFRAIFAEGAFSAAFVPSYARARQQQGAPAAGIFADRVFTLLLASQVVLLVAALLFTPAVIRLLAPGLAPGDERFGLAITLTRITFPYLLLTTLVTLLSGMLNAVDRFAAAASAPVLLNLAMMAALAAAAWFPTVGHAAAWGVLISGVLQLGLVAGAARRAGMTLGLRRPRLDPDIRRFFGALVPATVGYAGVQLAQFADTIIATYLSVGALSALYYADRLNQLPIGVIGIAAGTVLLPDMARRIAAGDEAGASHVQNRAIELTLLLALPFLVAFLIVPDLLMRALFMRGAFTAADAAAAAATLRAYALGLLPFVLIRSLVATFFARGDTRTPVKASLTAVAVNVVLKILLMGSLAQVGLALATSIGAWINMTLVLWFAWRGGLFSADRRFRRSIARLGVLAALLAVLLLIAEPLIYHAFSSWPRWRDELTLLTLAGTGGLVYGAGTLIMFGSQLRFLLRRTDSSRP
jgi:putative peptidoglycan lipid II flippase